MFKLCYIQNHVITKCVIRRFRWMYKPGSKVLTSAVVPCVPFTIYNLVELEVRGTRDTLYSVPTD